MKVQARPRAPFPLRAVDTDAASVRVCRISRQESPRLETATGVGTNRSQERAPYFQSKRHSDTPTAYAAPGRHGPSACGRGGSSLYLLRHSTAPRVLVQLSLAPNALAGA